MKVRDATPVDLDAVTALHADAFAGTIGVLVGAEYLRAFIRWFTTQPGGIALVADDEDGVVGYVVGAPDGYGPRLTRELLPTVARGVVRHLPKIALHPSFARQVRARLTNLVWRREPNSRIHVATPPGSMCLVAIGTSARARGRGVGATLIDAFARRAHDLGYRTVLLDVYRDNERARRLYDRTGFVPLVEEGRVIRMARRAPA